METKNNTRNIVVAGGILGAVIIMACVFSLNVYYYLGDKNVVAPKGTITVTQGMAPVASVVETSVSGIYFEPGSIVAVTGFIKENIKQIDAPLVPFSVGE